jgi:ligand-binding sensor domain-containing protein
MQKQLSHILTMLLLASGVATGQNLHLTFYSQANGLPSHQVRDVIHDDYGLVWIASDGGLLRFDGSRFTNYSQQIPSQYSRAFCRVPEGLLLSHDAGISLLQPGLDTSVISTFLSASINPDDQALYYPDRIFRRANGERWVSQPGGRVSRVSADTLESFVASPTFIASPQTTAFFIEPEGGPLWIAFSDGRLCQFQDRDQSLRQVLKLEKINALALYGQELWLGGKHLSRLSLSAHGRDILQQETFLSAEGEVTALSIDSQGNIYLGIKGKGLYYLDQRYEGGPQWVKVYSNNNPHSVGKLPFQHIHKLIMEPNDRLWVCSAEGLGILQRRFFENLGSIPNTYTSSLSIAQNGKLFVSFGDIYAIEPTDLGYEGSPLSSFSEGNISALTAAGEQVWAGSSTGKLFNLTQAGKPLGSIDLRSRGEGIFHLNYDSSDRLWICQAPKDLPLTGVLCLLPGGSLKEYGEEEGLLSQIRCFHETQRGRLYCSGGGKESYLYRYLPDEDIFINLSLPLEFDPGVDFAVHDLSVDKEGVIWLASTHGLLRYDMARTRRVAFPDKEIRAVCSLDDGSVWGATEKEGLFRFSDSSSVLLSEASGLPSSVMTYRCLVKEPNGRLWAGSSEGLVYSLHLNPSPQKSEQPLLSSAFLDGVSIPTQGIEMLQGQQLSLSFLAPAFHGAKTYYQYRINEGAWTDLGTLSAITLPQLQVGNQRLGFRSRKEGGYLWSPVSELEVRVKKPFYQNPLWVGLFCALLLGLLVGYLLNRKHTYRQKISELSRVLLQEKSEMKRTHADLAYAKDSMVLEQRQLRAQLFSLEIIRRLISKISPGMKWELVLEIIANDLLRFPGIVAFEIGVRQGAYLEREGYAAHLDNFTTARLAYQPKVDFCSYAMDLGRPMIFSHLKEEIRRLSLEEEKRLAPYQSALCVPFYLKNKPAMLFIYSDKPEYFTRYGIKAIEVFVAYLDQITEP